MMDMRKGFWILAFFAIGCIAYAPTIKSEFIFDDFVRIVRHSYLDNALDPTIKPEFEQGLTGVLQNILPDRPVLMTTVWLNYLVGGANPIGYKITNILLHCLNAALLWLFLLRFFAYFERKISSHAAALIALLFLLHPLNSQAVNVVIQRGVLLSVAFALTALLASMRYLATKSRVAIFATVLLGLLSVLSKQNTVVLPLLLLTIAARKGALRAAFPLALVLFAVNLIPGIFYFYFGANLHAETFRPQEWLNYGLAQSEVVFFYLSRLFIPFGLNIYYPFSPKALAEVWPYCLFHGMLLAFALRGTVRGSLGAMGLLLFYVSLIPESSVFPIPHAAFDHRMYFPLCFLAISGGAAAARIRGRVFVPVAVAIAVSLGFLTFQRNEEVSTYKKWLYSSALTFKTVQQVNLQLLMYLLATRDYAEGLRMAELFAAANPADPEYSYYKKVFANPEESLPFVTELLLGKKGISYETRIALNGFAAEAIQAAPLPDLDRHEELVSLCAPQLRLFIHDREKLGYDTIREECFREMRTVHQNYLHRRIHLREYQKDLWVSILKIWAAGWGTPPAGFLRFEEVPLMLRLRLMER